MMSLPHLSRENLETCKWPNLANARRSASPWKTLSRREIYRNPWIRLREDRVIQPDGAPSIYSVLECQPYVGVVPLDRGHVFLINQWRYPKGRRTWEIPTGSLERKETPLRAAKRELAEEAGLAAKRWRPLGRLQEANSASTIEGVFFMAEQLTGVPMKRDGSEADLVVHRFSWADMLRGIDSGRITDSISVAVLLKCDRMLRERTGE